MNTQYSKGCAPGPGRPKGHRNVSTRVLQLVDGEMLDQAKQVLQEALDAKNLSAAKFVLKHALGTPRGAKVQLDLPATDTAAGVDEAQQAVLDAVAGGAVASGDARTLFDMLEVRRKAIAARQAEPPVAAPSQARAVPPACSADPPPEPEPEPETVTYGPMEEDEWTTAQRIAVLERRYAASDASTPDYLPEDPARQWPLSGGGDRGLEMIEGRIADQYGRHGGVRDHEAFG